MPKTTFQCTSVVVRSRELLCTSVQFLLVGNQAEGMSSHIGFSQHDSHYCAIFRQQTLDSNLTPYVPPFTNSGLTDYLVELIVSEDEVHISKFNPCIYSNLDLFRPSNWLTNHLSVISSNICDPAFLNAIFLITRKLVMKLWTEQQLLSGV